ncbi:MAG: MotA/TolQ/ExbB proton channel family protein [Proteobacteria bacterium]|nr:MotA/TolQ/ExbB proton channel family protein [Pseudomonadota bacterium]
MDLIWLEQLMYQLSGWFMAPVLIAISVLFLYSLFAMGGFAAQWWQRRQNSAHYDAVIQEKKTDLQQLAGYPLMVHAQQQPTSTLEQLDVMALKQLEVLRITTRIAPMLGLIGTMIPMAPALKSLSNGNVQGISESLIIAFSVVIFGMVIASVSFWIATVKKRWLATELVDIARLRSVAANNNQDSEDLVEELTREAA